MLTPAAVAPAAGGDASGCSRGHRQRRADADRAGRHQPVRPERCAAGAAPLAPPPRPRAPAPAPRAPHTARQQRSPGRMWLAALAFRSRCARHMAAHCADTAADGVGADGSCCRCRNCRCPPCHKHMDCRATAMHSLTRRRRRRRRRRPRCSPTRWWWTRRGRAERCCYSSPHRTRQENPPHSHCDALRRDLSRAFFSGRFYGPSVVNDSRFVLQTLPQNISAATANPPPTSGARPLAPGNAAS